jgi:hypothetical protein
VNLHETFQAFCRRCFKQFEESSIELVLLKVEQHEKTCDGKHLVDWYKNLVTTFQAFCRHCFKQFKADSREEVIRKVEEHEKKCPKCPTQP